MMTDDQLAEPERRLVAAARTGRLVDLRAGDAGLDDPADGASRHDTRAVRAELLIELLTAEPAFETGGTRAIKMRGARITGPLDLEACTLTRPLLLRGCHFDQPVNLREATAPAIRLPGCDLPGLSAGHLRTTGSLELDDGFTAHGEVDLLGAQIGGRLSLVGAHLANPGGCALNADGLTVGHDMCCGEAFTANGEVNLLGARIEGRLDFSGAQLSNPEGCALKADGLTVGQGMFCRNGFTAVGEVRLPGGHIKGVLDLDGARLSHTGGYALTAARLVIEQDMYCRNGFTADERIDLVGAHIGGRLDFSGARLSNPRGCVLDADGLTVEREVLFRRGFSAEGEVRLSRAQIGGFLLLNGRFTNPDGYALTAEALTIDKSMYCQEGLTVRGGLHLAGAQVGSHLDLRDVSLNNPGGLALDLEAATARHLILRPAHTPRGGVDLTNVRVSSFDDDQATWPSSLLLRGFSYDTLENDQVGIRDRLRWLRLHPGGYAPQIYDQLAAAYRRAGRVEAARRVGVAKQWRRRSALHPLNWLLYLTVGYGYRTWLAALWLTVLAVMGTRVFTYAQSRHLMRAGPHAPAFHPLAYTLDVLVPIIDLGQRKAWTPHGWALYWSWALIAAGWILTTAVVAGLTGILKRD